MTEQHQLINGQALSSVDKEACREQDSSCVSGLGGWLEASPQWDRKKAQEMARGVQFYLKVVCGFDNRQTFIKVVQFQMIPF